MGEEKESYCEILSVPIRLDDQEDTLNTRCACGVFLNEFISLTCRYVV